jgi:tripartite-type tricarboxylate transporter receptor subunit TctC
MFLVGFAANSDETGVENTSKRASQTYPVRLVRIVEPFGMGGGPDLLARAIAQELPKLWHQPVIVEKITGGGATEAPHRSRSHSRRLHIVDQHECSRI